MFIIVFYYYAQCYCCAVPINTFNAQEFAMNTSVLAGQIPTNCFYEVNASAFASMQIGGLIIKLRQVRVKLNSLK